MNYLFPFKEDLEKATSIETFQNNQMQYDLSKNEMPWDMGIEAKRKILTELLHEKWNRYPGNYENELKKVIAEHIGIDSGRLLLGKGSSTLISLIIDTFSHLDFVIPEPTFFLYSHYVKLRGATYYSWKLSPELEYDLSYFPVITRPAVIFICSPNNPTGCVINIHVLEDLLKKHPECIFVVDEAYFEFAKCSTIKLADKYDNIIFIRTFSKAYASASVRLGYLVTTKEAILGFNKMKSPFIIDPFTAVSTKHILTDNVCLTGIMNRVELVIEEREKISRFLSGAEFNSILKVFPSFGNFLFMRFFEADIFNFLCDELKCRGFAVQFFPGILSMRISIGDYEANELLLQIFTTCIKKDFVC